MITEETAISSTDRARLSPLRMPVQAAPIDRTPSPAAFRGGTGVEADGILDDIMSGIQTVGQVAGPVVGALGALGI